MTSVKKTVIEENRKDDSITCGNSNYFFVAVVVCIASWCEMYFLTTWCLL